MAHPLVEQLRFTRGEFERAIKGVSAEDALHHFGPMNCISWIVGHLAAQEQLYWLTQPQGLTPVPEVNACGFGQPMSTPPLDAMLAGWHTVTAAADAWLETLDTAALQTHTMGRTQPVKPLKESIGTRLHRTTYHYWYHMGEVGAIRQMLGHQRLPTFVGDIGGKAPYVPE